MIDKAHIIGHWSLSLQHLHACMANQYDVQAECAIVIRTRQRGLTTDQRHVGVVGVITPDSVLWVTTAVAGLPREPA
jgi:hypothetical protein